MGAGSRWEVLTSMRIFVAVIAALTLSHSLSAQVDNPENWQSVLYADHQLVGKVWSSREQQFITPGALWSRLISASYLLLGEKHDNPDHHALQLAVIEHLISDDAISQITFEMLDSNATEPLSRFLETEFASDAAMQEFLYWDEQGWDWQFYGPLLRAAYHGSVPVTAGNISLEMVREVYSAPTPQAIEDIFDAETMARLNSDIDESHCGMLPKSQFSPMVRVQQTRDFTMAKSLRLKLKLSGGIAVLVAGNYHVRHDLGVPNYLLTGDEQLERKDIVSLALLEVVADENEPARYLEQFGAQPAYDYIWFTPAVSDEDYCDSLR